MAPCTYLFIFDAGSRRLGSNDFWNSSYKEKTAGLARVSRLSFRFLWLWWERIYLRKLAENYIVKNLNDSDTSVLNSLLQNSPWKKSQKKPWESKSANEKGI